ncbi:hypothetical protein BKI52_35385 [marine bacterium AO1-C]|nr:hypothetical protein BKI52_35385 [marine bacterium AO1-C]
MKRNFSARIWGVLALLWLSVSLGLAQVPPPPTVTTGGPNQNPHNKIKRWQFGGNFALLFGDPIVVDASPTVAYNLSRKFRMGVGANYRYHRFRQNDSITMNYGGNGFVQFQPIDWFFVSGEYEALNVPNPEATSGKEGISPRVWQASPLLGAGLRFRLLRLLRINVSLLRDFNYQPGVSTFPSPWRFRMGFSF